MCGKPSWQPEPDDGPAGSSSGTVLGTRLRRFQRLRTTESFDCPPFNGKGVHQPIDELCCVMVRIGGQVGVFGGSQDGVMAEDFLNLEQIDTRFY